MAVLLILASPHVLSEPSGAGARPVHPIRVLHDEGFGVFGHNMQIESTERMLVDIPPGPGTVVQVIGGGGGLSACNALPACCIGPARSTL